MSLTSASFARRAFGCPWSEVVSQVAASAPVRRPPALWKLDRDVISMMSWFALQRRQRYRIIQRMKIYRRTKQAA